MESNTSPQIYLTAIFNKATTTVDGGWNLTFSLSQDEADKVMIISQFRDCLLKLCVYPQVSEF